MVRVLFLVALLLLCKADLLNSSDVNSTKSVSDSSEAVPADFMSAYVRNHGGIVVHFLLLGYACLSLALVCDSFFIPIVEKITEKLALPPDIAGASLTAMASSSPELFSNIISVFGLQNDLGTGTILGSAVFNVIVIPAACGFAVYFWCQKKSPLDPIPVFRDLLFYGLILLFLIIVAKDNVIDLAESSIMVLLYCEYIFILYLNSRVTIRVRRNSYSLPEHVIEVASTEEGRSNEEESSEDSRLINEPQNAALKLEEALDDEKRTKRSILSWLLYPMKMVFYFTIPQCDSYGMIWSFLMCTIWIGLCTYVCVWMVTIIGETLSIPSSLSGLTLLAAGASLPELVACVVLTKKSGSTGMAISSSVGSNIFDILICLGAPWLVKCIIAPQSRVAIHSTALPFTISTLFATIVALIVALYYTKWNVSLALGISCTLIYILFLIISCAVEIKLYVTTS